jgi:protein-tyrosine phosphatase
MTAESPQHADPQAGAGGGAATLRLDGCTNFRALGGMPTPDGELRHGMLYRSDAPARLSPAGAAAFAGLGITTVVDLRTAEEAGLQPWTPLAGWRGARRHLPLVTQRPRWAGMGADPVRDAVAELYLAALAGAGESLRAVVELLADPGSYPVLVHCTSGRDRTAVVVATVLRLLGIGPGPIADDYALSPPAERDRAADGPRDDAAPVALLRAERSTMLTFLAAVDDRFGSFDQLIRNAGVNDSTVASMRQVLLVRR